MALAASMDLLTMTIPNRLCLTLALDTVYRRCIWACRCKHPSQSFLWRGGSGACVRPFLVGLDRRRRRKIGGGDGDLARLGLYIKLRLDLGHLWWSFDARDTLWTPRLFARLARGGKRGLRDCAIQVWRALRYCARRALGSSFIRRPESGRRSQPVSRALSRSLLMKLANLKHQYLVSLVNFYPAV